MTYYAGYTRDRNTAFMGLSWTGVVVLTMSVIVFLHTLVSSDMSMASFWRVGLVGFCLSLAISLVTIPIRGRSSFDWLTTVISFYWARLLRTSWWSSKAATGQQTLEEVDKADLPGGLGGVVLHAGSHLPSSHRRLGILYNRAQRRWIIIARVEHPGLAMSSASTRANFGGGLTDFLQSMSQGCIADSVSFTLWSAADLSHERTTWLKNNLPATANEAARQIFLDAERSIGAVSVRSYAFVAFSCSDAAVRKKAKELGSGKKFLAAAMRTLADDMRLPLLGTLGCQTVDWLDTEGMATVIAAGFDPNQTRLLEREDSPALGVAGPSHGIPETRYYRHGGWVTSAAAIVLPKDGTSLGALSPVLAVSSPEETGGSLERRAVTITFSVLSQSMSQRSVKRRESLHEVARGAMSKMGVHASRNEQIRHSQEANLANRVAQGETLVRASCVAATTVADVSAAPAALSGLDASIKTAGFHSQPLNMAHDSGFVAAVLPLGFALDKDRGI